MLRQTVKDHIGGLNFGYRKQLREKSVTYVNAYAVFIDPHTVEYTEIVKKQVPELLCFVESIYSHETKSQACWSHVSDDSRILHGLFIICDLLISR